MSKEDQIIKRWFEGELSEDELSVLKNHSDFEYLKDLKERTDRWQPPSFNKEVVLQEILHSSKENENMPVQTTTKILTLKRAIRFSIAASIALLIGFYFVYSGETVYSTTTGQTYAGVLPDGSEFALNAKSEISFRDKDWDDQRSIDLEGEAFFNVKKGSRFKVETANGRITVLGTQFNVRSRSGSLIVECAEGRVKVVLPESKDSIILNAGEGCSTFDLISFEEFEIDVISKWRTGESSFRNVPLEIVLSDLELQFDIKIVAEKVDINRSLSCNFQHNDLEEALDIVLIPLGLNYVQLSDGIIEIRE